MHDPIPETVEEFFGALEQGIQQDGKCSTRRSSFGRWTTAWRPSGGRPRAGLKAGGERARANWQKKGPGNTNDLAERTVSVYTPDGVYSANLDGGDDRVSGCQPC